MNERDITTIINQLDKLRCLCVKALEEVKEKKKHKLYVKNSTLSSEIKQALALKGVHTWGAFSEVSRERTSHIMQQFGIATRRAIAKIMEDNKLSFAEGYDFVINK